MRMRETHNMTQSEEYITRMTSYRFPYHNSRSFAGDPNDALPYPVIQSGGKNAV